MPQADYEMVGGKKVYVTKGTGGKAAYTTNRQVDESYSERMAREAKEQNEKKQQKDRDSAMATSPKVQRALAAATGFGGPKS